MYQDKITLTAYNSESESERLIRLERVVGYLCALADHYGNKDLLSKIESMNDHKGNLEVVWLREPTQGEKEFLSKAWSSSIGDGADNVDHKTHGYT